MSEVKNATTVTREELYAQVWTTPVDRLAESYGISGRGLSKICARLNIPVPPRGYWARLAAGQKVTKYKLLPLKDGIPDAVRIAPTPPAPDPQLLSPDATAALKEQKEASAPIAIAKTLNHPHPVVQRWLDENRKEIGARQYGSIDWRPDPIDGTPLRKRRLLILSALFKELERRGHAIKRDNDYQKRVYAEINSQRVDFELEERIRQVRRRLTPLERNQSIDPSREWQQDKVSTGALRFRLTEKYALKGLKIEWLEDVQLPLENHLADILASMAAAATILAKRDQERRETEQRRYEAEQKRYEQERIAQRENNRWKHVTDMAVRSNQCAQIRLFLEEFEQRALTQADGGTVSSEVAEWLTWAKKRTVDLNPLSYGIDELVRQNLTADPYSRPLQWSDDNAAKSFRF